MKRSPIFKRIMALALSVVLCLSALPMTQVSAAIVVDSGTCGTNLTWTLDDTGKLTISGTGAMINYNSVAPISPFYNDSRIRSVEIKNGVTSIGNLAFEWCENLTSITIPNSVTTIGEFAFRECDRLVSITFPASVTSIGDHAFYDCNGLTSITIPNSVTNIGTEAFYKCTSLTSITIPASVTSIGASAFSGCTSLSRILFSASVTSIGVYTFSGCTSLTSITIPNGVTSIGDNAFWGCESLTSVTIPDSVTTIADEAFSECLSLTSITIPASVTSIGEYAFAACIGLTSITIPDGVTSISDGAFSYCTNLTSITIPNSMTSIRRFAFFECYSLNDVYFAGSQADWEEITVGDYNDPLMNATVHYADLPTVAVQMDVASFRSGETYTAPSKEGYVFAGWYKDAAMTMPLGETVTTGTAYAKFVDEDVLSVKWQLSSGTTADSAKTALRVLTTVDALSYSRVGFTVEAPGKETKELTSKTVYETIYGYTGSNNESYKPTIFSHASKYFMAHTLSGIPQNDFSKEIKVTPKWTTLDGTEVTGKPLTIRIIDAIGG